MIQETVGATRQTPEHFMMLARNLFFFLVCVCVLASAMVARAQDFPVKPVRMIVPFPPGGTADFVGRVAAQALSKEFAQQVLVDNRGGAGGTIGADLVSKAAPDGYTLLLYHIGMAFGPALYASLPYDPLNDFAPISMLGTAPSVLVVNPSLPVRSIKEFIALARSRPGELNYGSAGAGSSGHLAVEYFQSVAGIKTTHVAYKGGGPAISATIGGEVAFMIETAGPVVPQIKSGRLRALGLTGAQRLPALPDVPTIAESGLKDYVYTTWYAIWAPAKTPPALVNRINQSTHKAMAQAETRSTMLNTGIQPEVSTPAQLAELVRTDTAKWGKIIRDAGIKSQ